MQAKILIVEDEARLRASLAEFFAREGFEVTVAEDGAQVLTALKRGHPREMLDRVVGLEVGADHYMTKPLETRELLAQARALLSSVKVQTAAGEATGWLVVSVVFQALSNRDETATIR